MFSNISTAPAIDHGERYSLALTASAKNAALIPKMFANAAAATAVNHGERYSLPLAAPATTSAPIPEEALFMHDYWTTDETAHYLRCEPQTIRKNLSTKNSFHGLKPRRFGRRWYFKATDVRALLETV